MAENHFLRLYALGYTRLVPITPPDAKVSERSSLFKRVGTDQDGRGKTPGVKWSDGTWSGFDWIPCEATEADLLRWHDMGAGIGVKTGQGLIFVDSDTPTLEHAKIVKEEAERFFGHLFPRIGREPKWGFPLRTSPDFRYCRIEFGERDAKGRLRDRVEILSDGKQFVAHGVHPGTKKPYRWPQGSPPVSEIPFVEPETIHAFLAACAARLPAASAIVQEGAPTDVDQAALKGDLDLVRAAVAATPNTSALFPTRETYRDMGYAIKAATIDHPADGLSIYQDWCARWTDGDNDPDIVEADWSRMKPPFRRGASWLFETATANSDTDFSAAAVSSKWFDAAPVAAGLFPVEQSAAPAKLFQFTPLMDAANSALLSSTAPLIKGLLDQGAMTVLYGESNTGKTFLAMDLAFHVATGLAWGGMRTTRFPVLYIAAEGGLGARKRAAALAARYHEQAGSAAFQYLLHPINLLRADADLGRLIASVKAVGVQFGLIVVDTLSRAMAGGDENSSTDMGAMVKHLDALRAATLAHIMVVHHSGKDRAKGARGHSLLRAATDTEIEVSEGSIDVTKQRDLDKSFSSGFALDVMTLGVDQEGDPVTSCVVRLCDTGKSRGEGDDENRFEPLPLTERESEIATAVAQLEAFREGENEGVSVDEVVQFFADRADNMSENAARTMLKKLVAKRILGKIGRGRWKTEKSEVVQSGPEVVQNIFD
jgi:hypothetical protein